MPCDEYSRIIQLLSVVLQCKGLESEIDNLREALIAQAQKQNHVAQQQETHNELVLMN